MKKKDTRLIFPVSPPNPWKHISYWFYLIKSRINIAVHTILHTKKIDFHYFSYNKAMELTNFIWLMLNWLSVFNNVCTYDFFFKNTPEYIIHTHY